ncbi:hypothetical protein [Methanobrevibacter sp.]|uniref:hypothetical protein n=1 Tax=Methanobrevibacter sp. TaxID=66852 RepID=UPI0025E7F486|nr:hypothetical protein [Methanobrevibacter sp.]MBQ2666192.1 Ig-like domain-containing protein [Methanobrevibacter sp.]
MKKTILFVVLMFLLVGFVSASENVTNDTSDMLSVNAAPTDDVVLTDNGTSTEDVQGNVSGNSTPTPEKPTITTSAVSGTQGKYITLKATVKNSTGPIEGVTVTFKLNGNTYTAKTNGNGVASVSVKCPASAVLKTTTKKTSTRMTKTTYYSKSYTATASADGASSSFKVTSKKANRVLKYKAIKKTKTMTVPVKKGTKVFKRGNYGLVTYKVTKYGYHFFAAAMAEKNVDGTIKFLAKLHYKQNGKWHWDKWTKIPKNKMFQSQYPKSLKVDKFKAKYTQVTYKRIK